MNYLASISILCYNRADDTKRCLDILSKTLPRNNIEVILTNNGSSDFTDQVIYESKLPNKICISHGKNLGFPVGHNEAFKRSNGKYFVMINNDMIFQENDWLYKLLEPMNKDPGIAIVGLDSSPCTLRNDGTGTIGSQRDYVEGSCLAGRRDLFEKYGLFSPDFDMFFFEDSDLCLRYRQMGYKLHYVSILHKHIRGQTVNLIDPALKREVVRKNQDTFLYKWGRYLMTREFTNLILVKILSHGGGDVIACTSILSDLKREHPKAKIELETNWPDVFLGNPNIDKIFTPRQNHSVAYDRVISLDLNYASYNLIIEEAEKVAHTKISNKLPQLYLSQFELEEGMEITNRAKEHEDDLVIGVNLQMARSGWMGRNWRLDYAKELVSKLKDNGFRIIEFGKGIQATGESHLDLIDQTTLRQAFSVIANLDLFIGIDSMLFHVAQAFCIPTYVLFGATEPISRIVNFESTVPIQHPSLDCVGCYQRKGKSDYNKCIIGTEECMMGITPDYVLSFLSGEKNSHVSNIQYLQGLLRRKK